MQKTVSNILIIATVIAILPIQGFAQDTKIGSTNNRNTERSQNNKNDEGMRFLSNTERLDFIKNTFKEVRKKNIGDSILEKDTTVRAKKIRTLTESFHDRKKSRKEIIITATGGLGSIQTYLSNVDDSTSIKSIGNNLYSVTFQDGKNLDTSYFQDVDKGTIPEKLFDYPIVEPVLMSADVVIAPGLSGESITNLWGMTKMETTNYQSGLSLQSNPVSIAVIDTGVDRAHKDLLKNTWINANEIAGNGIDDDSNGYIDDVNGYDFVNKDSDPMDDHGHGSHVSGSAAGSVNGGGAFGVNSSAKIVGLKVLSAAGNGSSYDVYKAIYYAADNGIRVINMSLGGGGNPVNDPICAAIDYAKSKGTIAVVAGGNSNINVSTQVPAGCANAITVGAVDSTLTKAAFSNYGTKTDVAAPGVSIYSSLPGNTYGTWAGTSMATPYIAGLVSAIKTYKPALTVDDIKYILKTAALTEPVTSPVNIGRFPNMGKIFLSLGIKSDSELTNPPSPTTGSGTTGTGTTTPPIGTGSNAPNPIIDTTPPNTTIFPYVSLTNATGTTLTVAISENGSGYYVVLPSSASAPSNTSIVNMNNIIALKTNTPSLVKIGGLEPSSSYQIWFIAKDLANNLQIAPVSVGFTTSNTPVVVTPPKANEPPTLTYTAKLVSKNTYELTIVGKDTDGTIQKYEMYFKGRVFSTLPKVTVQISGGSITVSAKVYDNLGLSATNPYIVLPYVK